MLDLVYAYGRRLKQAFLQARFKSKIKNLIFDEFSIVSSESIFEGANRLHPRSRCINSYLGFATYLAPDADIRNTKIGSYCSIGDYVRTGLGQHPISEFISTHPSFFSIKNQSGICFTDENLFEEHSYIDEEKKYYVEIGNDVWIGYGAIIMDGIKIGDGAIIAAGAIVTKDVEDFSIVGGVPAKHIKYRFDKETRDEIIKSNYWNIKSQDCGEVEARLRASCIKWNK